MAVGDAHVFPSFLSPVLTQLFFLKPPTTFLTCSSRGENTPERTFAQIGSRTQTHHVMSPTRSSLSNPGGALWWWCIPFQLPACYKLFAERQNLGLVKMHSFPGDGPYVAQMLKIVTGELENILEKGKITTATTTITTTITIIIIIIVIIFISLF